MLSRCVGMQCPPQADPPRRKSSRPYPGRSVQQAVYRLLTGGNPVGQNRKNKPEALTGARFHLIANETKKRTEAGGDSASWRNP